MNDVDHPASVPGLTIEGCKRRQDRFARSLGERDLDAALICDRRHVHYLTGYWHRSLFAPAVLIRRDGQATLSAPLPVEGEAAADEIVVYESNRLGTLVDDQLGAATRAIQDRLEGLRRIGCDGPVPRALLSHFTTVGIEDLTGELLRMRRQKDPDELALLRFTIGAAEAAYQYAKDSARAGTDRGRAVRRHAGRGRRLRGRGHRRVRQRFPDRRRRQPTATPPGASRRGGHLRSLGRRTGLLVRHVPQLRRGRAAVGRADGIAPAGDGSAKARRRAGQAWGELRRALRTGPGDARRIPRLDVPPSTRSGTTRSGSATSSRPSRASTATTSGPGFASRRSTTSRNPAWRS